MRRFAWVVTLGLGVAALFAMSGGAAHAQPNAAAKAGAKPSHVMVAPDAIQWQPFLLGSHMAVIAGDPEKVGASFTIRIKANGLKVPPHWHPTDEHITVLSGAFLVATGEKFDASALHEMKPGAYAMMPKKTPHFALMRGETIIQVHGIGPFQVIWVNPEDDPARQASGGSAAKTGKK